MSDSLRDFILKDEQNIRVALAVSEAWPGVRGEITRKFLEKLSRRLSDERPTWQTDGWQEFFVHGWATFDLRKPEWKRQYWIALEANRSGELMAIGVQRDDNIIKDRPNSLEVLAAVRSLQPAARVKKWWEAWSPMALPAPNWRTPEALWGMHSDAAFLESVAEQLLAVASAVEPLLDALTGGSI